MALEVTQSISEVIPAIFALGTSGTSVSESAFAIGEWNFWASELGNMVQEEEAAPAGISRLDPAQGDGLLPWSHAHKGFVVDWPACKAPYILHFLHPAFVASHSTYCKPATISRRAILNSGQ
jgi:hypothetical protein